MQNDCISLLNIPKLFGYSQNIRRHNAMCRDELVAEVVENIVLKLDFLHQII